jgi:hypothetical protein
MDFFSFDEFDDSNIFANNAYFNDFEKTIVPLDDLISPPQELAKRPNREECAPAKRLKTIDVPSQLVPFPSMEEYVCPKTRAYELQIATVKQTLQEKQDKRYSKNMFVQKELMRRLISESEAKSAEVKRLNLQIKETNRYWEAQSNAAQPRIVAITSLIKTQTNLLQCAYRKTITMEQTAIALKDIITPMLPVDIAHDVRKLVNMLCSKDAKMSLKFTADGAVFTIKTGRRQMSSKSPTATSSAIAVSTSCATRSSSSSSSWK